MSMDEPESDYRTDNLFLRVAVGAMVGGPAVLTAWTPGVFGLHRKGAPVATVELKDSQGGRICVPETWGLEILHDKTYLSGFMVR